MTKTTAVKNKKRVKRNAAEKRALQQALQHFKEWLGALPSEVAANLEELFKLHAAAEGPKEKAEISETINELLLPEIVVVKLEEAFAWNSDDEVVRKNLTRYRKNVGSQIKKHRLKKGLNQMELADMAGIPQSHVCRLETGKHVPTYVTIERIANALGVCPSQLDPGFEGQYKE